VTMWQFVKDIPGSIKFGAGIVGGLVTGMATVWGLMLGPVANNAQSIETIGCRMDTVEKSIMSIQSDMTLVRCWALHEIQGTDASQCLFSVGGT